VFPMPTINVNFDKPLPFLKGRGLREGLRCVILAKEKFDLLTLPSPRSRRGKPATRHSPLIQRFSFAHPATRSSAFSMFSIELATLKRR
jgi:hypothetical protein